MPVRGPELHQEPRGETGGHMRICWQPAETAVV